MCVCGGGWGGGWEEGCGAVKGTGKVIHLFQTALKNLANKYFNFGQFLILSSVVQWPILRTVSGLSLIGYLLLYVCMCVCVIFFNLKNILAVVFLSFFVSYFTSF